MNMSRLQTLHFLHKPSQALSCAILAFLVGQGAEDGHTLRHHGTQPVACCRVHQLGVPLHHVNTRTSCRKCSGCCCPPTRVLILFNSPLRDLVSNSLLDCAQPPDVSDRSAESGCCPFPPLNYRRLRRYPLAQVLLDDLGVVAVPAVERIDYLFRPTLAEETANRVFQRLLVLRRHLSSLDEAVRVHPH